MKLCHQKIKDLNGSFYFVLNHDTKLIHTEFGSISENPKRNRPLYKWYGRKRTWNGSKVF
nr:MAG TPA: hypothetical protein [Caudoviricetes sp.]DAL85424.1 MAG TPA: hypothetical protein [Caudoviricetes sp.]